MKLSNLFFPFLFILFFSCKTPFTAVSHSESLYAVKDSSRSDTVSVIENYLKPYRDSLSGIMNEVIGFAESDFIKEKPSGSLGNLIVDAMQWKAKQIDSNTIISICNYGGIRINQISNGNIIKGKIYELLPFENELVILEMNGTSLKKWFQHIAEDNGWPFKFYKKEIVQMSKTNDSFSESFFTNSSVYYVATNDYVANGGDNCEFLKSSRQIKTGLLIRDIVIEYIRVQKNIVPDSQPRIEIVK